MSPTRSFRELERYKVLSHAEQQAAYRELQAQRDALLAACKAAIREPAIGGEALRLLRAVVALAEGK